MPWLPGYTRRRSKVVNDQQTDYQMNITIYKYGAGPDSPNQIYLGGHCRDDFGDIRFTGPDQTTIFNYWIESYVSGNYAIFWFKTPSIPLNPNNIYIYYDNPSVTAIINGDNTFIFFDDFNGTTVTNKWTILNNNLDQLSESGGYLTQGSKGGGPAGNFAGSSIKNGLDIGSGAAYRIKVYHPVTDGTNTNWQRFGFEFSSTGSHSDTQGVCSSGTVNTDGNDKYMLGIYPPNGYNEIDLYRYNSGTAITLATKLSYSIQDKFIDIQYLAPNINVYSSSDGITWGSPILSTANAPAKTGRILFTSFSCQDRPGTITYDYIFARNFKSPEPSLGTLTTEELNITAIDPFTLSTNTCIGPCSITAGVTWRNYGNNSVIFRPAVLIDGTTIAYGTTDLTISAGGDGYGLVTTPTLSAGAHTICPYPN